MIDEEGYSMKELMGMEMMQMNETANVGHEFINTLSGFMCRNCNHYKHGMQQGSICDATAEGSEQYKKNYQQCEDAWVATLAKFGIERPMFTNEKMKIARLIKLYDWKYVLYGITGMRYEEKTQSFDPGKHVGLYRLDDPDNIERFVNLACQQKSKGKT